MDEDILDATVWIQYAQGDYANAKTLANARAENPYAPNGACFHCQQCAEKAFKAYMIAKDGKRTKEHDLNALRKRCESYNPEFHVLKVASAALDEYKTKSRYPSDKKITEEDMDDALKYAHEVLLFTKSKLKELGYEVTLEQNNRQTPPYIKEGRGGVK